MFRFSDFIYGMNCPFRGAEAFFRHRPLWKYAVIPFAVMVVLYLLFMFFAVPGVSEYCGAAADRWMEGLPEYLEWFGAVVRSAVVLTVYLFAAALLIVLAGPVYELIGGPFFDSMILRFYRDEYGAEGRMTPWRLNLLFAAETCFYAVGTCLWMVVCIVLFIFVPVIGPAAAVFIMGYRIGVNYIAAAGLQHGMNMRKTRKCIRGHFPEVLGYGTAVFIIFTVPFAYIFFLPGVIIGGAILFNRIDPLPVKEEEHPPKELPAGSGE